MSCVIKIQRKLISSFIFFHDFCVFGNKSWISFLFFTWESFYLKGDIKIWRGWIQKREPLENLKSKKIKLAVLIMTELSNDTQPLALVILQRLCRGINLIHIYSGGRKRRSGIYHFISNWQWIGAKCSLIQLHLSFLDAFIGIRPINTSRSWLEACELDDIQFAINSQA